MQVSRWWHFITRCAVPLALEWIYYRNKTENSVTISCILISDASVDSLFFCVDLKQKHWLRESLPEVLWVCRMGLRPAVLSQFCVSQQWQNSRHACLLQLEPVRWWKQDRWGGRGRWRFCWDASRADAGEKPGDWTWREGVCDRQLSGQVRGF